jgi:hypothetical protein
MARKDVITCLNCSILFAVFADKVLHKSAAQKTVEASGSITIGYIAVGFITVAVLALIVADIPQIIHSFIYMKASLAMAHSR